MTNHEILTMSRKAESIYTSRRKNQEISDAQRAAFMARHSKKSFEKSAHKFTQSNTRVCYVNINGITMPVSA